MKDAVQQMRRGNGYHGCLFHSCMLTQKKLLPSGDKKRKTVCFGREVVIRILVLVQWLSNCES